MPVSRSRTARSACLSSLLRPRYRTRTSSSSTGEPAASIAVSASVATASASKTAPGQRSAGRLVWCQRRAPDATRGPINGERRLAATAPTITDNDAMDLYAPFADIYEDWSSPMTEDISFYVELAQEADGPVVELAVGTGRVGVPVARELGRPIIGIDVSPAMLAKARATADAAAVQIDLREGDMR